MKKLRPYQTDCVSSIFKAWTEVQRNAVQLATGAGKSVIIAQVCKEWRDSAPKDRKRIVFLVHRAEILRGCADTIAQQCPDATVRIVDGSVQNTQRWKNLTADIVLFNTATLGSSKNAREKKSVRARNSDLMHSYLTGTGLVVLDECHRATSPTAMDCLTELGVFRDDGPKLLGCTATLFRDDAGDLSDVFERRSYSKGLVELIAEGFLVPPRHLTAMVDGLDLTKVGSARLTDTGEMDLKASELAKVLEESGAYGVVAEFTKRHAEKRKTLVFTPNVESAERVAEELNARGIKAAALSGTTNPGERADIFRQIQHGDLQAIVNCQIATEGTDLPAVSCVVLARPTRSRALYRQIVGRGVRLFTDENGVQKKDALIIDLVGATTRNDLATISDLDDDLGDVQEGESITEAVSRHKEERAEFDVFTSQMHDEMAGMGLDEEDMSDILADMDTEYRVTGSFNCVETDPYTEAVRRAKKKAEQKEKEARAAAKKKPAFPNTVDRYGWWIKAGETSMFMSLASFEPSGHKTKGSYIAAVETLDGWVAFRKDTRVNQNAHFAGEKGRYYFIGMVDDDTPIIYKTLEEVEDAALAWAFENMGESSGAINYRLNPNSDSKRKPASAGQIKYLRSIGCGDPEAWDLYDAGEMKPPTAGLAGDLLDVANLGTNVIKQAASIRKYLA